MQSELSWDPTGNTPGEALDTETDSMLRQAAARQKEVERSGPVENKECEERKEKRGDDQPINTEAELWTEDLRATWLGFSPGV
jgi:hypothetical protein